MNKRILLGIDTNISPATQRAIRAVCEFMERPLPHVHLVLLHVIPEPFTASPSLGMYVSHMLPTPISSEQRDEAEEHLYKALTEWQTEGMANEQTDVKTCRRQN